MPDNKDTGGGAVIGEGVSTGGGDFVGRDQIVFNITYPTAPFVLEKPDLNRLRVAYLDYIQETCRYLDFKGTGLIEAVEKASGLSLESVYVPLKARPEMPEGETWQRIAGRLWKGDQALEGDVDKIPAEARPLEPVLVDAILNQTPALVLLGDPGSGKSTLLKMLALELALREGGPLPILVPLNAYAHILEKEDVSLHDFLPRYFASRQGRLRDLRLLFDAALAQGQAVVLLDGLDEVQQQREYLVRLVDDFVCEHVPPTEKKKAVGDRPGNRVVVTSRFVGYREAPVSDPRWVAYALVDWERDEIERFVERWSLATELAMAGGVISEAVQEAAGAEQRDLLAAIHTSPGIQRLAGNPLLLTILALIKRQGVSLPNRRVELYETYVRTLLSTWNKARALDKRPVGPEMDYLQLVQILAPLALWLRETNPTAGLVALDPMMEYLSEYYQAEEGCTPAESRREAREFLEAVHRYSNLLLERGRNQFGFIHLTFEEYLAGKGLAALDRERALGEILSHLSEPGWHETLLLGIEALGVVSQQPGQAGALLEKILDARLAADEAGADTLLAGEVLVDVGRLGVGKRAADRTLPALVEAMQAAAVKPERRRRAGLLLGRLGWQPEDLDGFVEVPAGEFLYGEEKDKRNIPYKYWIAKYPVTNLQYARFMQDGGYARQELWSAEGWVWRTGQYDTRATEQYEKDWLRRRPTERRDRPFFWDDAELSNPITPVVGVSWFEAEAYCRWLNTQPLGLELPPGYTICLPLEEEWERAARGIDGREYPWGPEFDFAKANVAQAIGEGYIGATAVCTYPQGASPAGAWDMSGNVWEWMASWYDRERRRRVVRGGSWIDDLWYARCASHFWYFPVSFLFNFGLRVVVSLADAES